MMKLVRCVSCDGYGWFEEDGETQECDWCGGLGYVYRDAGGVDRRIPASEYEQVADRLEYMEKERLRELGYSGESRRPWEQKIRQGRGTADDN